MASGSRMITRLTGPATSCSTSVMIMSPESSPVGVSKASGLRHVADALGVGAEDVLAIGDGRNDLEMLRWAGRGVAMGQSVPEVHEAADATTLTVDEDGAAAELSLWFPER